MSKSLITEAIKFHIEDITELVKACKGKTTGYLFTEHKSRQMPYKKIWVDFEVQKNIKRQKFGMLIIAAPDDQNDNDQSHQIFVFARRDDVRPGAWFMNETYYLLFKSTTNVGFFSTKGKHTPEELIKEGDYAAPFLTVLEYFILLLNCKNITTESNKPSDFLNKARKKRGKQELFTYKTLKLLLPGKKEKHILINEPTGEHNRIHLCRGHFKEYTREAPLFGKITGLWWWQPTVRGKNKNGIVIKDYECAVK